MLYVESFHEFQDRMACDCIMVAGRHLFANGGQSDGTYHQEPPADKLALLRLQIQYLTAKLTTEERLFKQCREYITLQSEYHSRGAGPLPAEEAFTDLEQFQKNVLAFREQLQAKQTELDELRGPSAWDLRQAERDQQRTAARDAIQRARSLEI